MGVISGCCLNATFIGSHHATEEPDHFTPPVDRTKEKNHCFK